MEESPSRAFEKLVAAVQCHLDPNATVEHDVRVQGIRSGKKRQIDVAVRGRIGSKQVLVVVECRNYKRAIDVGKIDGFAGFLEDVQASAGIMVTTVGYSETALERAAAAGIETWVLRPAREEDWERYVRSLQLDLHVLGVTYYECKVGLADGRVVQVSPMTLFSHPASDQPITAFSHLMNYARQQLGFTDGTILKAEVGEPLFLMEGDGPPTQVRFLSAVPRSEELLGQSLLAEAPQDWVFRRYVPGSDESDREFLEIARLKARAQDFGNS